MNDLQGCSGVTASNTLLKNPNTITILAIYYLIVCYLAPCQVKKRIKKNKKE
tara:strand:+ start:628 stop:783 length:156 start_codon:yes stop_codon:yes gene_type:complete